MSFTLASTIVKTISWPTKPIRTGCLRKYGIPGVAQNPGNGGLPIISIGSLT